MVNLLKTSLLALAASCVQADLVDITDSNFNDYVFRGPEDWSLVWFDSPHCPYCRELQPQYESLGPYYNNTKLGIYRIDSYANTGTRKAFKINGFPTVRLFKGDGKVMEQFDAPRTTEELMKFVRNYSGIVPKGLESFVVKPTEAEFNDKVFNNPTKDVIVVFHEPYDARLGNVFSSYLEQLARHYALETSDGNYTVQFASVDVKEPESGEVMGKLEAFHFPVAYHIPGNSSDPDKLYRIDEKLDGPEALISVLEGRAIVDRTLLSFKELDAHKSQILNDLENEVELEDDDGIEVDDDLAQYGQL